MGRPRAGARRAGRAGVSHPPEMPAPSGSTLHPLRAKRLWIETQHEPIVFTHADCPVARSEGFAARAQVQLSAGGRSALATLYQVSSNIVAVDEVGLSETVWHRLGVSEGAEIKVPLLA